MLTFLMIIIIIFLLFLLMGDIFFTIALNRKIKNKEEYKKKKSEEYKERQKKLEEESKWVEENTREIQIISYDNLSLKARILEKNRSNHKWVILIHCYKGNHIQLADVAKKFYQLDRNCLMVDLRAHGKSEGKYIGMGYQDKKDILKWIEYIIKQDEEAEIVLYGVSMGAATVMMTIGEKLPKQVKSAIEDCGYTSVWDEFQLRFKKILKIPTFPILPMASIISKMRAGYFFKEASCVQALEKAKTPILFIHGEEDRYVPFEMLETLYKVANSPKEKLVIQGARHTEARKVNPTLYWSKIEEFIEKYK